LIDIVGKQAECFVLARFNGQLLGDEFVLFTCRFRGEGAAMKIVLEALKIAVQLLAKPLSRL
jgi:hypothetical protein